MLNQSNLSYGISDQVNNLEQKEKQDGDTFSYLNSLFENTIGGSDTWASWIKYVGRLLIVPVVFSHAIHRMCEKVVELIEDNGIKVINPERLVLQLQILLGLLLLAAIFFIGKVQTDNALKKEAKAEDSPALWLKAFQHVGADLLAKILEENQVEELVKGSAVVKKEEQRVETKVDSAEVFNVEKLLEKPLDIKQGERVHAIKNVFLKSDREALKRWTTDVFEAGTGVDDNDNIIDTYTLNLDKQGQRILFAHYFKDWFDGIHGDKNLVENFLNGDDTGYDFIDFYDYVKIKFEADAAMLLGLDNVIINYVKKDGADNTKLELLRGYLSYIKGGDELIGKESPLDSFVNQYNPLSFSPDLDILIKQSDADLKFVPGQENQNEHIMMHDVLDKVMQQTSPVGENNDPQESSVINEMAKISQGIRDASSFDKWIRLARGGADSKYQKWALGLGWLMSASGLATMAILYVDTAETWYQFVTPPEHLREIQDIIAGIEIKLHEHLENCVLPEVLQDELQAFVDTNTFKHLNVLNEDGLINQKVLNKFVKHLAGLDKEELLAKLELLMPDAEHIDLCVEHIDALLLEQQLLDTKSKIFYLAVGAILCAVSLVFLSVKIFRQEQFENKKKQNPDAYRAVEAQNKLGSMLKHNRYHDIHILGVEKASALLRPFFNDSLLPRLDNSEEYANSIAELKGDLSKHLTEINAHRKMAVDSKAQLWLNLFSKKKSFAWFCGGLLGGVILLIALDYMDLLSFVSLNLHTTLLICGIVAVLFLLIDLLTITADNNDYAELLESNSEALDRLLGREGNEHEGLIIKLLHYGKELKLKLDAVDSAEINNDELKNMHNALEKIVDILPRNIKAAHFDPARGNSDKDASTLFDRIMHRANLVIGKALTGAFIVFISMLAMGEYEAPLIIGGNYIMPLYLAVALVAMVVFGLFGFLSHENNKHFKQGQDFIKDIVRREHVFKTTVDSLEDEEHGIVAPSQMMI